LKKKHFFNIPVEMQGKLFNALEIVVNAKIAETNDNKSIFP